MNRGRPGTAAPGVATQAAATTTPRGGGLCRHQQQLILLLALLLLLGTPATAADPAAGPAIHSGDYTAPHRDTTSPPNHDPAPPCSAALCSNPSQAPATPEEGNTSPLCVFVDPATGLDSNGGSRAAPLRSIARAAVALRDAAATGSNRSRAACAILLSGRHVLNDTLELDSADSGVHFVADTEAAASISGGTTIHGWRITSLSNGTAVWSAQIEPGLNSRHLFVNGRRAQRTRVWFDQAAQVNISDSGLLIRDASLHKWQSATQSIELVFTGGCKGHAAHCAPGESNYREARCSVVSVVPVAATGVYNVSIAQPCWSNARYSGCGVPSYVENVFDLAPRSSAGPVEPGSFFHDSVGGIIRYVPREDETSPSAMDAVLPLVEVLVHGADVSSVSFSNLTFEHATWLLPSSPAGFVDDQAGTHVLCNRTSRHDYCPLIPMQGNLHFERSTRVSFTNCSFAHLGGAAIYFDIGCQNNLVSRGNFTDVSAAAVQIGAFSDYNQSNRSLQTANNTVEDSTVTAMPVEFHGSAALTAFITQGTTFRHNKVVDTPYSAMTLGWGWTTDVGEHGYSCCQMVEGNIIRGATQMLFDGGSVYTLGNQPNSQITRNHIFDQQHYFKGSALYHDQGSGGWLDSQNVLHSLAGPRHGAGNRPGTPCYYTMPWVSIWNSMIHDILVADNFVDYDCVYNHGTNTTVVGTASTNRTVNSTSGDWSAAALQIISEAGPRHIHRVPPVPPPPAPPPPAPPPPSPGPPVPSSWNAVEHARKFPPRGWNGCMGFGCYARDIGEATYMAMADAMASNGLRDAGYNWLNLDNGFIGGRGANGSLECHKTGKKGVPAFPSGTLHPLAAHLATHNMSLGAYTDRGTMTCGNVAPGSEGYEAQDAQTFVDWGVRWVKSDSCSATSDFPAASDQYRKMAAGFRATGQDVFFSLCGWWAAYAALVPEVGDSWRIATDVASEQRWLVNVEIAASVANFSGPGPDRGWPDVDMISGHWDAEVERMRLSFIAVVGSPLLLSFDVRNANSSTLGIDAYLNSELLAIHGDDASPAVKARGQYYGRITGGAVTGPHSNGSYPAGPVDTESDCVALNAQWHWHPSSHPPDKNHSWGTLESAAIPGYCLALWDTETGKFCLLPLLAQLVPCGRNHDGCAAEYSQQWGIGGAAHNWSLATALDWSGGPNHMGRPGVFLTHVGVPGGLYVQSEESNATSLRAQSQRWVTNVSAPSAGVAAALATRGQSTTSVANTTIRSVASGKCLGSTSFGVTNVWARWLANGDVALLLFNVGPAGGTVACDVKCFASLQPTGDHVVSSWHVRDVWARTSKPDIATAAGYVTPPLPSWGSQLLRLSPA